MNLAWSSLGAEPGPASDRASFSGLSPIHASSVSDSSESNAEESSAWREASTPRGAGVAVGSGVGGLAGVALGAAVGLSVEASGGNRAVSGRRCCDPGRYLGRSRDFFQGRCCVGAGCQGRQSYQEEYGCREEQFQHWEFPFLGGILHPFYLPPPLSSRRICQQSW